MSARRTTRTALAVATLLVLSLTMTACSSLSDAVADELAGGTSPMRLGIVPDLRGNSMDTGRVDRVAASGVTLVREGWDLGDLDGAVFDTAARRGLTVLPVLTVPNGQNAPDRQAVSVWMAEFARQFGPGGSYWQGRPDGALAPPAVELLNEPYLAQSSGGRPDAGTYAELVKFVVPAIRAANPEMRILLSADVSTGADDQSDWIGAMYEAVPELNDYFDAVAIHPYGNDPVNACDPSYRWSFCRMSTIRSRFNDHGAEEKRFWITEIGNPTGGGTSAPSEAEQADFLAQYINISRRSGYVDALVVYSFQDLQCSDDRECFFGLHRVDGTPKPAWQTLLIATGRETS